MGCGRLGMEASCIDLALRGVQPCQSGTDGCLKLRFLLGEDPIRHLPSDRPALAAALVAACAPRTPDFDQARITETVRVLSGDDFEGRAPATAGEQKAVQYLVSQLTAAGLTMTIFFYMAINLSMVMGMAPVVGIPLPLFSYGGSSMLTIMTCVGIILLFLKTADPDGADPL